MDLKAARRDAERLRVRVNEGVDPQGEKRDRNARLQAEAEEVRTGTGTVGGLLESYLAYISKGGAKRPLRSYPSVKRLLKRSLLAEAGWGKRSLASITSRDVSDLLQNIIDRGAPFSAQNLYGVMRPMFNYAVEPGGVIARSPITFKCPVAPAPRDRVLSPAELRAVWLAADAEVEPWGELLKVIILTGCRRSEAGNMEWAELDLDAGMWTLPGGRSKNRQRHVIHLNSMAVSILRRRQKVTGVNAQFVFTITGRTGVAGFAHSKRRIDATAMIESKPLPAWRLHDLRRTFASLAVGLEDGKGVKLQPHVIDKVLNHQSGVLSGVRAVYIRAEFMDDRKEAMDVWGAYIKGLVN